LKSLIALLTLAALAACTMVLAPERTTPHPALAPYQGEMPPPAPREFRAAWVATVANIDWPSRSGLPVAQQQAEVIAILDQAQRLKLNAIVLQVRPSADAMYPSALEPWSEYLSGGQGNPPEPFYDPLALWIAQAHARGIQLHAWINPYRARHSSAKSPLAATHISRTHPEAVKTYGDALWMDPAEPAARQQTLDVVTDLVQRYDLDGVHMDDYFYPYPIATPTGLDAALAGPSELDFPDEPAWSRYTAAGGQLTRADWRREQVNQLIEVLYGRVHQSKPWVLFGISPFGLGRPDHRAPGISGFSQYDSLYADAETWLARGWLDYLAPQLYWPMDQKPQAFAPLLDTWAKENVLGRHLWAGLFTSRIDASAKSWQPEEILRQIELTRGPAGASGHIHFSMLALMQNRKGISDRLQAQTYTSPALVPASPWLEQDAPGAPSLRLGPGAKAIVVQPGAGKEPKLYAIWKRFDSGWHFFVQPSAQGFLDLADDPALGHINAVVVTAIDHVGNESPRVAMQFSATQP
jgi:uncharacterized lipoprotein YddW (UPF0748 family)